MKTRHLILAGAMALAAGLGMSMSTPTHAAGTCDRLCKAEYTQCWYSCTPGDTPCYDLCRTNYYNCYAEMCP